MSRLENELDTPALLGGQPCGRKVRPLDEPPDPDVIDASEQQAAAPGGKYLGPHVLG